jgi:uncharacterized membrane-anchored protein
LKTGRFFAHISDAFQLNSVYRPINWQADYVLSDRRKAVIRKRYFNLAIWLASAILFVLMLVLLSGINTNSPTVKIATPKTAIHTAKEAYTRGHFAEAQELFRQEILSGSGSDEVWMNYDRSLLMKTFQNLDSGMLTPSNSIRSEQPLGIKPATTNPDSDYLTDEEWQKMQQDAHEWLGC